MNACILRAPRSIIAPRLWSLGAVKTANFDPYAPTSYYAKSQCNNTALAHADQHRLNR